VLLLWIIRWKTHGYRWPFPAPEEAAGQADKANEPERPFRLFLYAIGWYLAGMLATAFVTFITAMVYTASGRAGGAPTALVVPLSFITVQIVILFSALHRARIVGLRGDRNDGLGLAPLRRPWLLLLLATVLVGYVGLIWTIRAVTPLPKWAAGGFLLRSVFRNLRPSRARHAGPVHDYAAPGGRGILLPGMVVDGASPLLETLADYRWHWRILDGAAPGGRYHLAPAPPSAGDHLQPGAPLLRKRLCFDGIACAKQPGLGRYACVAVSSVTCGRDGLRQRSSSIQDLIPLP
jgi:hypothetical protein